jgi:hypothetical protein
VSETAAAGRAATWWATGARLLPGQQVERRIRDLVLEDSARTVTDRASRDGVVGTPTVLLDGQPPAWSQLGPDDLAATVHAAS